MGNMGPGTGTSSFFSRESKRVFWLFDLFRRRVLVDKVYNPGYLSPIWFQTHAIPFSNACCDAGALSSRNILCLHT